MQLQQMPMLLYYCSGYYPKSQRLNNLDKMSMHVVFTHVHCYMCTVYVHQSVVMFRWSRLVMLEVLLKIYGYVLSKPPAEGGEDVAACICSISSATSSVLCIKSKHACRHAIGPYLRTQSCSPEITAA